MKARDIMEMTKEDKEKRLKELKLELIKAKANSSNTEKVKIKEIKKLIARIITLNKTK